ncbi:aspartic proteinase nepenthesin-1-like [Coffea eugenioides]|uniref:Aspartic proteinase nepenthesin-1-like n=1 Tax=Coffea arabica TaxID=13443 RepID=A0A6P6TGV7_COFAR|nr:aspartic proteinase nepenthesin-1-like [Coffea arabica]XP_027077719.1 aspartic proteinase nepenthesin-1-like [Coffea arabica]XP_027155921.1 aspartic proteinase nepenthesin-1-like [Coffea eugenioides]XP_027179075.1 aspartic proteinase nepenthesin-1-like [Coffea eugenioides]
MASFQQAFSSVVLVVLAVAILFVTPTFSTSRNAIMKDEKVQKATGFQVTLKHVDSGSNLTKFELLQRAMKRGRQRLNRLSAMALAESDHDVKSSVHPGNGEFLMQLSMGTPSTAYSAIMDTGSDLIWTQCKPCQQCFDQSTPIFDPRKSSSFSTLSCSSSLCEALPMSSCGTDGCEYLYTYGDYSTTQGVMAAETFTFGEVSVPKVAFGCGEDNEGSGFGQGAGLVGLGRGPLSLVSQLDEPKFSYCLTSIDDSSTSTLLMGSLANANNSDTASRTTPLVVNPSQPSFYYLSLEGITVGGTRLPIKKSTFALNSDGSGGIIIDSGTTLTYLEKSAFDLVKKEFTSQMKLPVDKSGTSGLDLCFTLPSDASDIEVPKLVFHFKGADVDLPGENYMIADSSVGLACLAMGSSSGMSIFGNVQQQNYLLLHDLQKETLSFIPTKCNQL